MKEPGKFIKFLQELTKIIVRVHGDDAKTFYVMNGDIVVDGVHIATLTKDDNVLSAIYASFLDDTKNKKTKIDNIIEMTRMVSNMKICIKKETIDSLVIDDIRDITLFDGGFAIRHKKDDKMTPFPSNDISYNRVDLRSAKTVNISSQEYKSLYQNGVKVFKYDDDYSFALPANMIAGISSRPSNDVVNIYLNRISQSVPIIKSITVTEMTKDMFTLKFYKQSTILLF